MGNIMSPPHDATQNHSPLSSESPVSRRKALGKMGLSAKRAAKIFLPLVATGLLSSKADAQFRNLEVSRALNFILQIEFMQESFYVKAISRGKLKQPYKSIFTKYRNHQQAHVILIKNTIASLGVDPAPQLYFDFSAGGQFKPYKNFEDFLALAQIIEDAAVGAYKKQISLIYQNNADLILKRTVMQLHSTETRHAYYVRFLRNQLGFDDIKGWINSNSLGTLPRVFANIYAHENQTVQHDIDVPSVSGAPTQAVYEAWDEPLGRGPLNDIFQLFNTRPNLG